MRRVIIALAVLTLAGSTLACAPAGEEGDDEAAEATEGPEEEGDDD
jgi:hypothetical protein